MTVTKPPKPLKQTSVTVRVTLAEKQALMKITLQESASRQADLYPSDIIREGIRWLLEEKYRRGA
jgi:hypothetical protein